MIDEQTGSAFSRRSLVKGAATAAAVGGVLALAGPAATAEAATGNQQPSQAPATGHESEQRGAAAVLVRVLDARLGTLEVYTPTGHRTITDSALAAQLTRLDA